MAQYRPTLRLGDAEKRFIDRFKEVAGCTKDVEAFRLIIDRLARMDAQELTLFFRSELEGDNPLSSVWDVVQAMSWGENAFRWADRNVSWAIREYQEIKEKYPRHNGIYEFACYRLAFCWSKHADRLRREALSLVDLASGDISDADRFKLLYDASDESRDLAVIHNRLANARGAISTIEYNLACDFSTKVMCVFEVHLPEMDHRDQLREIANIALNGLPRNCKEREELLAVCYGLPTSPAFESIRGLLEVGLEASLRRLKNAFRFQHETEANFSLVMSREDPDLQFLRHCPLSASSYNSWTSGKQSPDALEAFRMLQKHLPQDTKRLLSKARLNATAFIRHD